MPTKIVVTGPVAAGKTTFVQSLGGTGTVSTEEASTRSGNGAVRPRPSPRTPSGSSGRSTPRTRRSTRSWPTSYWSCSHSRADASGFRRSPTTFERIWTSSPSSAAISRATGERTERSW
mgnify:CR=1 FL=1